MINKKDLEEKYAGYSLTELLEVIENKHNYTDTAVVVAIEELSRRKVTEEEILLHKQEQIEKTTEKVKRNYVDRLTIWQKHFFFFIWLPLLTFPFKRNFTEGGFEMKLKQARYFSLLGFISVMAATYFTIQFNLDNTSFWLILIPEFALTLIFDGLFNPVYVFKENAEDQNNQ